MTPSTNYPDSPDEAIPRLLDAHGDDIYRLGLRLCNESEFAEDLVQETFLRAYRNWGQFDGRSKSLTWLYSIASRACQRLERRRAGQPRRIEPLSRLLDSGREWELDVPAPSESPLDYTIRREEVERLHQVISTLPAPFRLPLILKELEGLTITEVAEILGLREATVKTRLHRARLTLRQELLKGVPLPQVDGDHTRNQCIDLIAAKLEAMAHGVAFPIENERICSSCNSTLTALDRTKDLCAAIPTKPLPPELRGNVLDVLREFESAAPGADSRPGVRDSLLGTT